MTERKRKMMDIKKDKLKWILDDAKEELQVDDEGLKELLKDYVDDKKKSAEEAFSEFLRK